MRVRAVKESKKKLKVEMPPGLPVPPFLMTIVAPRNSGKTNLLIDLLTDENKMKGKFDIVLIWSRTYHLDPKWKNIRLPPGSIFKEFNEADVTYLMRVAEHVNRIEPVNALFIFDDMITDGIMNNRRMGELEAIAVRGRHMNVSIVILTQQYLALSPPVRNNTTNMCVFRIRNGDELEKIARENREALTTDEFKEMLYNVTSERYSFLHINNQKVNPRERFHKNWLGIYGTPSERAETTESESSDESSDETSDENSNESSNERSHEED